MTETPGEGRDESGESHDEDASVSEARVEATTSLRLPPQVAKALRSRLPDLTELITERIQSEVPEYAGSRSGRRRRLIAMAIGESAAVFVRRLDGRAVSSAGVDDLFRKMGFRESEESRDLAPLHRALHIAGRVAWQALQEPVVAIGLPASTLARLGDELIAFLDHLAEQAVAGHAMAQRRRADSVVARREELLATILGGAEPAAVRRQADLAGWPVPATVVLVAARSTGPVPWPDADDLGDHVLTRRTDHPDDLGSTALFLAEGDHTERLVARLSGLGAGVSVAHSWPMPLADARDAERWVLRALELVVAGALPRQQVIDCARFRTQLWLHAEPALRRHLAQELLKPLLAETPNSREILSETLLVWLETRESAPAIAAILGIHAQTVRYRWRRINELFGDALHDPEFVVQLTMVLKASVPLWVAGDHSDFERYWSKAGR
jgi:hypothetical protein